MNWHQGMTRGADKMPTKNKILIIEESQEISSLFEKFLEDKYDVLRAGNEKEGLEALKKNHGAGEEDISVVICDDSTINYNANSFLETVGSEYISTIKILMLNLTPQSDAEQLRKKGLVDHYIAKPFQIAEARKMVDAAVNAREKALNAVLQIELALSSGGKYKN